MYLMFSFHLTLILVTTYHYNIFMTWLQLTEVILSIQMYHNIIFC